MEEKKILIIDDDKSIRTTLSLVLEEQGFTVITSQNGVESLEKMKYGNFNIAVVDYKLPDTTGVALAREVKHEDKDIEIIILTGKASLESALEAIKEDVFDYLIKPVNPDKLIKVINAALEKQKLVREKQKLIWELKKKNKELEQLSKFKSGLISMLSHDLRSPISSLKGFNESFLEGFLGKITPAQKKIIKTENKVIDSMVELIDGLLDMEQFEVGKLKMKKKTSLIIEDVIKPVLERLSIQAKGKDINIELKSAKDIPRINVDPNRVAQVVQNLLQNAVKFTPKGGNIVVSAETCEMGVEVSVVDSGPGIESNELDKIFKVFYSTEGNMSTGRGLGLAISRKIIKAHGGMIWAESKGKGKGSKFVFILPEDGQEQIAEKS